MRERAKPSESRLSRRGLLGAGAAVGAGAVVAGAAGPAWAGQPGQGPASAGPLGVGGLRVDSMVDPTGIHDAEPTLSWTLTCTGNQREQTAYQVRVAGSRSRLDSGRPDQWDSGWVASAAGHAVYAGRALTSRTRAYWQVRVRDESGRTSDWSPTASFEMGLLNPGDWTAAWVGNADWDALSSPVPPATVNFATQRARFVRLSVSRLGLPLKEGWPQPVSRLQIAEMQVFDSLDPKVNVALNGAVTATDVYSAPGTWEPAYVTDGKTSGDTAPVGFTSLQHDDPDVSASPILLTIDLGAPQSFDTVTLWPRTDIRTADGRTPNFPVDFTIQTADSLDGPFTVAAAVTGQTPPEPPVTPAGLPLFARQFRLRKPVSSARLYVTGLGVYTATVNGHRAGSAVLEPGNTTYTKHLDYATLDVGELLRKGDNALGITVGTGIYDTLTYNARYAKFNARIGPPKVLAQLEVTYVDGSTERVVTDRSWLTALGPVTFSNWYGGEDYDARRLPRGWDQPGTDRSTWQQVSASSAPAPDAVLTSRRGPGVEVVDVLTPQAITQPKPGIYVFDFGTNVAGWQQLKVRGQQGTKITMRPAELLKADGTIDYASTGNPIYDCYTLGGSGVETWHPEFLYHGFRYIQVEGLQAAPSKDTLTALVLRAANTSAGSFSCSNELINGIHRIIDRAVQGNMFSVLTDCPTREKLGWMEQDHFVFDTVTRNYDAAAYTYDIVQAMADAQLPNGMVPDIAPEYTVFGGGFRDDPNWGNAMVIVPWKHYRTYGDRDLLTTYYPNMRRYVDYLTSKAKGHLLDYGLGDWATINATTPTGVTATYGYFKAADALSSVAAAIGNTADATTYGTLRDAIGNAFHAAYFDAKNTTYATGSQCSDALALDMGIVPAELHGGVLDHLLANLTANGFHLNLGEIGLPALFDVLAAAGRSDVVYEIATQTTAPSYGAMLARGATSLTEFWDGSGSQNHFMLGAIDRWFSASLAGIDQAGQSVGFADLLIAPTFVGDLTHVAATYQTPRGPVTSEWRRSGSSVTLDVSVPVGCRATVRLPGLEDHRITSGRYRITAPIPG
ncbi:family 78 glycoside hydrolase catalytic domain [Streptomyces sp. NPDC020917]|uniref:family 78 glycoside hydrolase catalytic domain n=1 Tax=Streptomyces sp. NPDC020917 TaxID=3365102 RepID=UPI0037913232